MVGGHVGEDVDGQFRLGPKRHLIADAQRGPPGRILELVGRDPDAGVDQRVSDRRGVAAVHGVHAVGDPPGAAHVLTLDPGGGRAGLGLPGLIQRRHHQLLPGQMLGHEPAYHADRLTLIPDRVVEQPLGPIRTGIPHMLGDGPPVLTRQVTHQRRDVLARLLERLHPAEARRQPAVQLGQHRDGPFTLYHGSRGRLTVLLCHNLMILGRPPALITGVPRALPPARSTKVRLPY